MAKEKWSPSTKLALAIAPIEETQTEKFGSFKKYGTTEHLAIIRKLVVECATAAGIGKEAAEKLEAEVRKEFAAEAAFLGYASNAKKMLQELGSLDKNATIEDDGY